MSSPRNDLQETDLSDFTLGIWSRRHSSLGPSPSPDGAAQALGTWGCYGLPGGGLAPLPEIESTETATPTTSRNQDFIETIIDDTPVVEPPDPIVRDAPYNRNQILAVCVDGPVLDTSTTETAESSVTARPQEQVYILSSYYEETGDPTDHRPWTLSFQLEVWRKFINDTSSNVSYQRQVLDRWRDEERYEEMLAEGESGGDALIFLELAWAKMFQRMGYGSIVRGRGVTEASAYNKQNPNTMDPLDAPSMPLVFVGMSYGFVDDYTGGTPAFGGFARQLVPQAVESDRETGRPEPSDPDHCFVYVPTDPREVSSRLAYHQGRLIATTQLFQGVGAGGIGATATIDTWKASKVNEAGSKNCFVSRVMVFDQYEPSGYGVVASVNANELIMVRHRGGGTVVRGDISGGTSSSSTYLASLPSTAGAANNPCSIAEGLVYGTREGVYVWAGGDGVDLISPQLEGWFWEPLDADLLPYDQPKGTFTSIHPWVFLPRNWCYNTLTKAWWKLKPQYTDVITDGPEGEVYPWAEYVHYQPGFDGALYALYSHFDTDPDDEGTNRVFDRLDFHRGAFRYSWLSQPLQKTRGRTVSVREVTVVAQGHGTVTVTISSVTGDGEPVIFTFDDDKPRAMTLNYEHIGMDVEVRLEARGVQDPEDIGEVERGSEAPTISRVIVRHRDGNSAS